MVVAMMKSHNCLLLILFARAIPLLVHTSTTVEDTMAEPASTGAGITETGVTTAAPAESTADSTTESTAPDGSTAAPGGSTAAPGGSTAAPGSSTAAPDGSTAAPGGSTAAPGSSTAAPDGSTAAPEDSTSMASTLMTSSTSTTSASTNPNSCSSVICQNHGNCYVNSFGRLRCSCRSGFTGGVCELIRRRYRITLTANNESGMPLTWDAAIYGDVNNQERLHLGRRLCTETVQAFRRSSNPEIADASHLCRLTGCREGSVLADLEVTVTFPANTTSPPTLSEMQAALDEGMAADNATFGSAPTVDYANSCITGNLCSRYGTCQNSGIGTYTCTCNAGFADSDLVLPGTTCTQLCSSSTCPGSNRVCEQSYGTRTRCRCISGYFGSDCSQQEMSSAIIGLIVACCVLFLLALASIVLYVMLRRRNNRAKKLRRVTVLDGDAYMINEVAKWRAVPSVRPDHSSVYGGWGPQTYPENAAASSVYIRGQEDTSAPPSGRRSGQPAKSLR